jgi:hypothetical protein
MCKVKFLVAFLFAFCFSVALPSAALAAGSFPAVNTYQSGYYHDVPAGEWYADAAKLCYETGLITGTRANLFSPNNAVTVGEAAAISARISASIDGGTIREQREGEAWYQRYVDFLEDRAVAVPTPTQNASRSQFFHLLAAVVPPRQLEAINSIETLPDTDDPDVLRFYNAGILTGTDVTGTFSGSRGLKRSECATMVARIIDPNLRQTFAPQADQTPPVLSAKDELLQTEAVRVNGISVSFEKYLSVLNDCIAETDASLKANSGKGLDWTAKYSDVDDLPAYFKEMALSRVVETSLEEAQAKALGCSVEALPAVLTPDPSKDLDRIYCAKHILVADEQTANAIVALLKASPSLNTFDALLTQYGTDPGMKADSRGYIFTDGDMVAEFENAVKALDLGACSNVPVRSSFGYHVILRLDPTTRPGWEQAWQERKYTDLVDQWMEGATITPNTAELNKLDVQARYAAYLASQDG